MTVQERISGLSQLGKRLEALSEDEFLSLAAQLEQNNNWFTPEQTRFSVNGIISFLDQIALINWLQAYDISDHVQVKSIGLMMAGNIPGIGFHDFLCVLTSGHKACVKLSSNDQILIKWLAGELIKIQPKFSDQISFEEMLKGKDAYVATGSDNSSRYFNYYFGKYPHIIRKNRTAVGILDGNEDSEDYQALGHDIFQYYGLGCRNVSKIYIKNKAQIQHFLDAIEGFNFLTNHHKYLNNYEYNKSIYLVGREPHLDNGFLLVKESEELVSPLSVLYFEIYKDEETLDQKLDSHRSKIQCIVSRDAWYPSSVPFSQAQHPSLTDYADHVDTMSFLTSIK